MRLTKIMFNGYKRLADTSCNVDGRLIAVLGPNEAGKSSVLEALAWLTDGEDEPLPRHLRSRALGPLPDAQSVVEAVYTLDDDDRAALAHLDSDVAPITYRFSKDADGTLRAGTNPNMTRRTVGLEKAADGLARVAERHEMVRTMAESGPGDWFDRVLVALQAQEAESLNGAADTDFGELAAWLRGHDQVDEDVDGGPEEVNSRHEDDTVVADLIDAARETLRGPNVAEEARRLLGLRRPDFLLFQEPDRVLASAYELTDRNLARNTPPALVNLLKLAGATFADLRDAATAGDSSRLRTLIKRCNLRLAARLEPMWRQSTLAAKLEVDGTLLQLFVEERTDDGAVTDIAERSEGLRTFIALVCFLADKESDTGIPPVLLIDEAETHLHYDAQADLIDVLLNDVRTSSVIYTTHSPGCLPPDLGTGIRLVAPDPNNRAASLLKAEFWHNKQPGFSPLLFAMGASAAAFSVCRCAVLAEGASDMILLPSLLRVATGIDELGYQVAPGLATSTQELSDSDIAARVVYLADGDTEGKRYKRKLIEQGVDESRIHLLPEGSAIEDLLTEATWFAAVNKLMRESGYTGDPVTVNDLSGDGPIASRLRDWGKRQGERTPSKGAVASYLVQDSDRIALRLSAISALDELHRRFAAELGRSVVPGGARTT